MSRFRLSSEAKTDVRAIWAYVAKDRPDAADHLVDDFYER
jgi:plasmid stabilization system protein ParE